MALHSIHRRLTRVSEVNAAVVDPRALDGRLVKLALAEQRDHYSRY